MLNGSLVYNNTQVGAGTVSPGAANDGLSVNGGIIQLGGPLATPAAAKLLDNRSIPFDVFSLLLDNIGKALGAHLKFKKDAGADGLFEPQIEIFNSAGATLLHLRVTDNNSLYFSRLGGNTGTGRNNVCICNEAGGGLTTGFDNVLIGAGSGFSLTTQVGWVVIGEDNMDQFAGSTAGNQGIVIGANNFNAGFITSVGNNLLVLGGGNNNSIGGSVGDNVIILGNNMGLTGAMHDVIIIGSQVAGGPAINISSVVILGTGLQNILLGQSAVGAVYQDTGERVQIKGTVKALNTSLNIRAGIAADTFAASDTTLLMNTGAGNMTVSVTPANLSSLGAAGINQQRGGIMGNVKKTSADVNTVTINVTAGQIFPKVGAPAASAVLTTQGQNFQFQSDGTNIYEL